MGELIDLAKRKGEDMESAFSAAAADPARHAEAFEALDFMVGHDRADQAEELGWTWLTEFAANHPPAESLALARRLLAACPASRQIRNDTIELLKRALPERSDLADWLNATGLVGEKVSAARGLRALDLALAVQPGDWLAERTSQHTADLTRQRIVQIVKLDPAGGSLAVRPPARPEVTVEILLAGDEYDRVDPDDFRVLVQTHPARLKELLADDPLAVLTSIIRAAGGQIDTDQLKDTLVDRVLAAGEYSKWWSRARTVARKSPNIRIEGRSPTMLVYDPVGTTLEQDTLATLARTWEPAARLAVVEGYLKTRPADQGPPDGAFLAALAERVARWLTMPLPTLGDELVAHRLAELGAPVRRDFSAAAMKRLAEDTEAVSHVIGLDGSLWPIALDLLPAAKPVAPAGPGPDDWMAVFLQLLPHAPVAMADRMAAALIDAGQIDRLNAEIMAIAESPLDCLDGQAWLWIGPACADRLDLPRSVELLDRLLWLGKEAENIATSNAKLAREVRATVRGALSARGFARFREHVAALDAELAPMLRRQIRRAEGLGLTVPESMLAILDERHPPIGEVKVRLDLWRQENVIYVSPAALAAKENELDHITNVLMPANSRAISAAAAHGDLSENSEYKFALEERDLLKARAARSQQELGAARLITADEVPTDHVTIYSRVELHPVGGGDPVRVGIVSPWDSNVTELRFNYKAPFSQLLLGKRVGETVRLSIDAGPETEFTIAALAVVGK